VASSGVWEATGISVSVTTHGEPVFVSFTGHLYGWADYTGLAIRRNNAVPEIAAGFNTCYDYAVNSAADVTITVTGVDLTAPAGTHTYDVWMQVSDGGANTFLWNSNLSVLEVNSQ
jgi:hypothetical protein